ncbi:MAG: aminotransferase class V-fold PLP-dependent enzyme, partial [Candidatus Eisenbacteria bacterium]|nr:aminotransferase class V-fold PLP-dependent enzyme [Candidatus Latescibacterota bacterium]MBD3302547.1 aminotransferase class V-fold PLP-dependent enzyme [Candidatus Eisenbacteria bacterium]
MVPIYLDHNATTPVAAEVLDALLPYLRERFGNPSSNHRFGTEAREGIERARGEVAALIGAEPDRIFFTSGGTEASQLALLGGATTARERKGDSARLRIVSFLLEHPATREPLAALERAGDRIRLVPPDPRGVVRIERFLENWTPEDPPDLVSLMHAHN